MLVQRWWRTRRHTKVWEYPDKWVVTLWYGWFLFGVVPLVIWPVSTSFKKSMVS